MTSMMLRAASLSCHSYWIAYAEGKRIQTAQNCNNFSARTGQCLLQFFPTVTFLVDLYPFALGVRYPHVTRERKAPCTVPISRATLAGVERANSTDGSRLGTRASIKGGSYDH